MKRMVGVFRKKSWFTLGFAIMLTILAGGQVFAAQFDNEEDALLYMREEEKLARDVYTALYDRWGLTIFYNIALSEQTHMDAIKSLLTRYKLTDPAQDPGVFTNTDIQALYNALIAQGAGEDATVVDALQVGVIIENTDIYDLVAALRVTVHKDTKRVFENLMAASNNHLDAFKSNLQNY